LERDHDVKENLAAVKWVGSVVQQRVEKGKALEVKNRMHGWSHTSEG
jgi:hypothetical protein